MHAPHYRPMNFRRVGTAPPWGTTPRPREVVGEVAGRRDPAPPVRLPERPPPLRSPLPIRSIESIVADACSLCGITHEELTGTHRHGLHQLAREVAAIALRERGCSFPECSLYIRGRMGCHSSIVTMMRRVRGRWDEPVRVRGAMTTRRVLASAALGREIDPEIV